MKRLFQRSIWVVLGIALVVSVEAVAGMYESPSVATVKSIAEVDSAVVPEGAQAVGGASSGTFQAVDVGCTSGTCGLLVREPTFGTVTNGQVSVDATADAVPTTVLSGRVAVLIVNSASSANAVFCGQGTPTTASGVPLDPGQSVSFRTDVAISCITAAAGSATVAYFEGAY